MSHIFSFLDLSDLEKCRGVSHYFQDIADDVVVRYKSLFWSILSDKEKAMLLSYFNNEKAPRPSFFPALRNVDLEDDSWFSDDRVALVLKRISGTNIEVLTLTPGSMFITDHIGGGITRQGFHNMGQDFQRSKLRELIIRGNSIGEIGEIDLIHHSPQTLQIVDLQNNKILSVGAVGIAKCLRDKNVQSIFLDKNPIGDVGAVGFIKNSQGNKKLKEIDLSDCGITQNGAKGLAKFLPGINISNLNLSGNLIGGSGALEIIKNLPKSVEKLNLSFTHISTEDLDEIMTSLKHTGVKILDLGSNSIDAAGMIILAKELKDIPVEELD